MTWSFTAEANIADTFATHINPFWQQSVTQSTFKGKGDVTVHYAWCVPENAKATIVISSGRIESYLKYKELIFDFYNNGFAVFILDHRGQGLSDRMTKDRHHGYVEHFDDYVEDLLTFVHTVVIPNQHGERYLVCHSMGGAIGTLTLLREPELFSKAVLAAPMYGIKPALPDWLASSLLQVGLGVNRLRRRDSGYFFGQTGYVSLPFTLNKLTHSQSRYRLFRALYDEEKALQLGGVTTEWLSAAKSAMDLIRQRAQEISLPMLVLSADRDHIIDNKRQREVVATIPNASLEIISDAYHELFIERDELRVKSLTKVLDFLAT